MSSGASAPEPSVVASVVPLVPAWRLDRSFDYLVPARLEGLREGCVVRVPLGRRAVRGVVTSVTTTTPTRPLEEIAGVVVADPLAPPPLDRLIAWLAARYAVTQASAFARVVPPRVRVKAGDPMPLVGGPPPRRLGAYEGGPELESAIRSGGSGSWCVVALPTEDRGELVSELVAAAGGAGDGAAVVLVPEVRHGSSVLDALDRHWSDVARVDSTQSDADRSRAWLRLARGHGLGAGGRGAVLAPARKLRLVVVDDEHNPAYKEERAPRFDARRVAIARADLQRAICVFISPTPSVEIGWAARSGRAGWIEPQRAAARAARPIVELVDVPRDRVLSHELHQRIKNALTGGGRVALLAPRRGYARSMWCTTCRRSVRCPRCEAGLTFDRWPRRVRCLVCGLTQAAPSSCPTCGSGDFRYVGAGSARLAEQLARAFPRAAVRRVDPDVDDLGRREERDADIYVTTWVGTKPALRPPVSLVGVLDADALIRRPDFRAAESAYHAIAEMAAWAGPAAQGGRLMVQTSDPSHHALQAVARADYRYFLERETEQRAELGYPPFSELVKVIALGAHKDAMIERVAAVAAGARATVLGPIEVKERAAGGIESGLEVLFKCDDAQRVAEALRVILADEPADDRLRVDVDPR